MISEFPLYIFTLLAGAAAGMYAIAAVLPPHDEKRPWLMPATGIALLVVGGCALLLHLGRPERVIFAFSNPESGISQEGYATMLFGVLVAIDLVIAIAKKKSVRGVRALAGIAGVALAIVIPCAYIAYHVQHAWSSWVTLPFFAFTSLALGAAVIPLLDRGYCGSNRCRYVIAIAVVLAALGCIVEGVHFAMVDADAVLLFVGAVLEIGAAIILFTKRAGSENAPAWIAFCVVLAATLLSRYGFYLAYAL